jgi:glycosyltransferase involved in cell wall biosynthesis
MPSGPLLLRALRRADALVALTREMRQEMIAAGLPPERITIVPSGVELPPGEPGPPEPDRLLFAGRLDRAKGLETLLEAVRILRASRPRAVLGVFGRGPEEAALRATAARLGLGEAVSFEGWTDRLEAELARSSAVVLPTLGEGMSNVLLEAMAAGRPVVTTDIPANRELVTHGENGLLAPPGDPAALAGAIGTLLDDPGLARRMGSQGRRRAERDHSLDAMAARYERLLLGGGAPA